MKMNKKGQFYLLTALLLCAFIFVISPGLRKSSTSDNTFIELKDNFVAESYDVINYAIYSEDDLSTTYRDYVQKFLKYSARRNVDFGVLYILAYDNRIEIDNYLNSPVRIYHNEQMLELDHAASGIINKTYKLEIEYSQKRYKFGLNDENVQFKALFKGEK